MSGSSSEGGAPKGLNLGLADLLSGKAESAGADDAFDMSAAPGASASPVSDTGGADAGAPKSELQLLAERQQWLELSGKCEASMSQSGGSLEVRLFWVMSQLRLRAVPSSILAAPLDSASREVFESQRGMTTGEPLPRALVELAGELLLEVGRNLQSNNDRVMALLFLERAFRMQRGGAKELLEVLNQEIPVCETQVRRNDNAALKQRLERLKSLREEVRGSADSRRFEIGSPSSNAEVLKDIACREHPSKRVSSTLKLVLLALLIGWGLYKLSPLVTGSAEGVTALEIIDRNALQDRAQVQALLPELSPVSGLGNLDAVYYELNSSGERTGSGNGNKPRVQGKEVVNTDSPLENAADSKESRSRIESTAVTGRPASTNGVREPLRSRSPGSTRGSGDPARYYPPDDVRPVGVEEFPDVREYEVMDDTTVMSKPSNFAIPIYDLLQGDVVRAEARVGKWLKLRSRQGRVGYVPIGALRQSN